MKTKCLIAIMALLLPQTALALSCVNPAMMPEKPIRFVGTMQQVQATNKDGQGCLFRYMLNVKEVLQGDVKAGDVLRVHQKHWICPADTELVMEPKTYALYPADEENIYQVGMCDGIYYTPKTTKEMK